MNLPKNRRSATSQQISAKTNKDRRHNTTRKGGILQTLAISAHLRRESRERYKLGFLNLTIRDSWREIEIVGITIGAGERKMEKEEDFQREERRRVGK